MTDRVCHGLTRVGRDRHEVSRDTLTMVSRITTLMYKRRKFNAPRSMGGSAGCDCGPQTIGAKIGAFAGNWGQQMFKNWTGLGDYSINTNSLIVGGSGSNAGSRIVSEGNREIRISGKEYIGDVFTHPTVAGAFYQQNFAINPGLNDLMPWLSSLAQQYQQWRPNGIIFEFISTSGDITNNQALGKIIIATDYNTTTLHTSFTNQQEMLAESYSQEAAPDKNMAHGLECAPSERARSIYFVRSGFVGADQTLADFDIAQTTVATVGGPSANTNLGSLYVNYDISFYKTTLSNGVANKNLIMRQWTATTGINTASAPFGTSRTLTVGTADYAAGAPRKEVADEDFICGNALLTFPRWAFVGSVWRLTYWVAGTATASMGMNEPILVGLASVGSMQGTPTAPVTQPNLTTDVYVKVTANTAAQRPTFAFDASGLTSPTKMIFTLVNAPQWIEPNPGTIS